MDWLTFVTIVAGNAVVYFWSRYDLNDSISRLHYHMEKQLNRISEQIEEFRNRLVIIELQKITECAQKKPDDREIPISFGQTLEHKEVKKVVKAKSKPLAITKKVPPKKKK